MPASASTECSASFSRNASNAATVISAGLTGAFMPKTSKKPSEMYSAPVASSAWKLPRLSVAIWMVLEKRWPFSTMSRLRRSTSRERPSTSRMPVLGSVTTPLPSVPSSACSSRRMGRKMVSATNRLPTMPTAKTAAAAIAKASRIWPARSSIVVVGTAQPITQLVSS